MRSLTETFADIALRDSIQQDLIADAFVLMRKATESGIDDDLRAAVLRWQGRWRAMQEPDEVGL